MILRFDPFSILLLVTFASVIGTHTACQSKKEPSKPTYDAPNIKFDKELQPLFDAYVKDAEARGVPVPKEFLREFRQLVWTTEIPQGLSKSSVTLGRCLRLNETHSNPSMRYRVVQITKPDARQMAGPVQLDATTLKTVVYHELGHCLHNFHGHRPESEESIMSTGLPKTRYKRLEELVVEHFMMMDKKTTDHLVPF